VKHILIPVDGSDCTPRSIDFAKDLARAFGSKITLLNVYSMPYIGSDPSFSSSVWLDSMLEYIKKQSQELLDSTRKSFADLDAVIETVSLEGYPADQIIHYVEQHDVDLVIMGTYGMGGFRRLFLGSTTHKVAVAIEKPILII
jgi:nucleotide-binding universal stress UspA family protein